MEGKTLALGAFNTRPGEVESMRILAERIEADMDPFKSAGQRDTDEVIKFSEIRSYLECIVECCYQAQNNRRIKNPRIWSLHDFEGLNTILSSKHSSADTEASTNKPQKTHDKNGEVVKAPLDGLFYLRAGPKDPPFVQIGSILNPGDTLGLIEVMKCFHPLKYEGSSPKKVKDILVQDNSPIKTGDEILLLE
jgi:biotin carboxyl carrier protein